MIATSIAVDCSDNAVLRVRRDGTTIVKFQIRSVCNIAVTPLTRRIVLEFAVPTLLMLVPTLLYQHCPSQAEVFHERGGLCSVRWADVLLPSRPSRGHVQQVQHACRAGRPGPHSSQYNSEASMWLRAPHGNQDSHPCFQLQSITGDLNLPASSGRAGRRPGAGPRPGPAAPRGRSATNCSNRLRCALARAGRGGARDGRPAAGRPLRCGGQDSRGAVWLGTPLSRTNSTQTNQDG